MYTGRALSHSFPVVTRNSSACLCAGEARDWLGSVSWCAKCFVKLQLPSLWSIWPILRVSLQVEILSSPGEYPGATIACRPTPWHHCPPCECWVMLHVETEAFPETPWGHSCCRTDQTVNTNHVLSRSHFCRWINGLIKEPFVCVLDLACVGAIM